MEKFIFPDLYCPFSLQINKYVDVLEEHALAWVTGFNLLKDESAYKRFCKSKIFLLIAGAYPNCEFEELKIANDWLTWMIFLDDYYDISHFGKDPKELKSFHDRLIEILLNGAELNTQDTAFAHALVDLRERTLKINSGKWFNFFVYALEGFLDGCVHEASNRSQGIVPDVETYITMRRLTGGMEPLFELIEFCNHLIIPDYLRNHKALIDLKKMTNNSICWCNDIFSVPKELAIGDNHNLVLILQHQQKISLQQALNCVAQMHNQELEAMVSLETSLPLFGQNLDSEFAQYLSGMHSWISSHFSWYSHSGRYEVVAKPELVTV
ncbi:MAG: terpene synthase [Calothrix sp. C42_A2020_038]|nr:terpene synthase [Calothrix sp. C42_A2020_038]